MKLEPNTPIFVVDTTKATLTESSFYEVYRYSNHSGFEYYTERNEAEAATRRLELAHRASQLLGNLSTEELARLLVQLEKSALCPQCNKPTESTEDDKNFPNGLKPTKGLSDEYSRECSFCNPFPVPF